MDTPTTPSPTPPPPSRVDTHPSENRPTTPPTQTPGSMTPAPGMGSKRMLYMVIGVVLLLFLAVGGFLFMTSQGSKDAAVTPTIAPTLAPTEVPDPTAEWETYVSSESGFTIKYPSEVEVAVRKEGDTTRTIFSLVGPSQKEATEFYDGISLLFTSGSLGGETLQAFVTMRAEEMEENAEITKPVTAVTVNNIAGYSYSFEGLGAATVTYLPLGTDDYIEITNGTVDPTNQGYAEIVERMFSTFSLE